MPELSDIQKIPLKDIKMNEFNVRLHQRDVEIDELANSIKKHTLLQPIALKGTYSNPPYYLVIGQRRFRAYELLKKKYGEKYNKINAFFVPPNLSGIDLRILSLSENIHRVELNYVDKAKAINDFYYHFDKDIKKVVKELGWAEITIREYVEIQEQATDKMKELWRKKKAKKIDLKRSIKAASGDPKKAERILEEFRKHKLTKSEKERAVDFGRKNPKATIDKIVGEGKTQRIGETIILGINRAIKDALDRAKKNLSLEYNEIAMIALEDWLKRNGFLI